MNEACTIAAALDRHLAATTEIVVYGSAALLLDRPFAERLAGRKTNDIDIIIPSSRELQVDADARFWNAIDATNRELSARGLYISHIFPEREVILSADWQDHLQPVAGLWAHLQVKRPRMLDLVLSKMGRADVADVADVRSMLALELQISGRRITLAELDAAAAHAHVPDAYSELFPAARERIRRAVAEFALSERQAGDVRSLRRGNGISL